MLEEKVVKLVLALFGRPYLWRCDYSLCYVA